MQNDFSNKERILIVGLPKSGTTILAYRVAACFDNTKIYFEPGKEHGLNKEDIHRDIYNHPRKNILSKALFVPTSDFDISAVSKYYNKKIWIYRDPRDWIISSYLYRWRQITHDNIENIIASIKKKENNPGVVPFHRLLPKKYPEKVSFNYNTLIKTINELNEDWYILKYEDFIDNRIDELNEYLGKTIDIQIEVDSKFERVVRSKSYDNWRDWFNNDDIIFFSNLLSPILLSLGYDDTDWELNDSSQLDPAQGSEYLLKLIRLKNEK